MTTNSTGGWWTGFDNDPFRGSWRPTAAKKGRQRPLLTEWRARREPLEGQTELWARKRKTRQGRSVPRKRTSLWLYWGTSNVLLPNGAGLPDPETVGTWLAGNPRRGLNRPRLKSCFCNCATMCNTLYISVYFKLETELKNTKTLEIVDVTR